MEVAAADIMAAAAAVDGTTDGEVTVDTDTIVDMETMDIMMAMVNLTPHLRLVGNLVVEVLAVEVLAVAEAQEALPVAVLAAEEVQEALLGAVPAVAVAVLVVAAVAVLAVAAEDVVESSTNVYLDVYRRWNLICIGSH